MYTKVMRISLLSKFRIGLFLSLLVVPEVYGQILFEEISALAPTDSRARFQRGLALLCPAILKARLSNAIFRRNNVYKCCAHFDAEQIFNGVCFVIVDDSRNA